MKESRIGSRLTIDLRLRSTAEGGRTQPISSGYRPLCVVHDDVGDELLIGLNELTLDGVLLPGASARGSLAFDIDVSEVVRARLPKGSTFSLAEGPRVVGEAQVIEID